MAAQRALVAWIERQGHSARIEYPVPGGRADIHVVIESRRHSLEVQISPITEGQWRSRDTIYRRAMDDVTWLFGDDLGTRATDDLLRRDVSFHIHVDPDLDVALGTRFVDGHIAWDELDDCKVTPLGLWTPHSNAAVAATHRWRSLSAIAGAMLAEVRRREEQALLDHRRRTAEAAERRRWANPQQMPLIRHDRAVPPRRLPSLKHHPWTRQARAALFGEATGWTPPTGWDWLDLVPIELQPSAQLLAYYVCHIYESGPVEQLAFDDFPDPNGLQVEALIEAGLITCYYVRGVRRWRRPTNQHPRADVAENGASP